MTTATMTPEQRVAALMPDDKYVTTGRADQIVNRWCVLLGMAEWNAQHGNPALLDAMEQAARAGGEIK